MPAFAGGSAAANNGRGPGSVLIQNGSKYLKVRESNGPNRSKEIDEWNRTAKAPLGSPYCASYVTSMHVLSGIKAIISPWSPDWFKRNLVAFESIQAGDVFGLYFSSKKRIAHVGFVVEKKGNYVYTLEANTSPDAASGSAADRDGDGVHKKARNAKLMSDRRNKYSRYWK